MEGAGPSISDGGGALSELGLVGSPSAGNGTGVNARRKPGHPEDYDTWRHFVKTHYHASARRWGVQCVHCGWSGPGRLASLRRHIAVACPGTAGTQPFDPAALTPHQNDGAMSSAPPQGALDAAALDAGRKRKAVGTGRGRGRPPRGAGPGSKLLMLAPPVPAPEAFYAPSVSLREVGVEPRHAAALFIDLQNYNCHERGEMHKQLSVTYGEGSMEYWGQSLPRVLANCQKLQGACRKAGVEVLYTVIQSLTRDGRDRSLDYKISGMHVPPGSWQAKVVDALSPWEDEIIIPKTSSSVFISTNIDYLLRSMDKKYLMVCGCLTDQCVEHAVKDACDLGYYVTLVTDCCATYTQERHDAALGAVQGYCRQRDAAAMSRELKNAAAREA